MVSAQNQQSQSRMIALATTKVFSALVGDSSGLFAAPELVL
jgi:hypothetical protein